MKLPLLTVSILLLLAACTPSGDKQAAESEPTSAVPTIAAPAATPDSASEGAAPAIDPATAEQAVNDAIEDNLGNHTRYQAVIRDLQSAVAAGDAAKVAALTHYPLSVEIGGKETILNSEQEFVARYAEIMTPDISKAIVDTSYANLFVNYRGVMFGKGEAWVGGFCTDDACEDVTVKLITLQHGPD